MFNIFIAYVAGRKASQRATKKELRRQRYEDEYVPSEHEELMEAILVLLGVAFGIYVLIS